MTDQYYEILSIDKSATLSDIRKAYRQKAKLLHPDINKATDANEKFILLNEAYEYLVIVKTGKIYDSKKKSCTYPKSKYSNSEEWMENEKGKARARANYYAKMRYEDYVKSPFYKTTEALSVIMAHLYILSSILLISSPLLGYFAKGKTGFFVGLIIAFITVHYWADLFKSKIKFDLRNLFYSWKNIVATKTFFYISIALTNLILLTTISLNTIIPTLTILLLFFSSVLLALLTSTYLIRNLKSIMKTMLLIGVFPGILNLFFLINFVFSSNRQIETYPFVHQMRWYSTKHGKGRYQKIAYIDLKNNQYKNIHWIRMFVDFEVMKDATKITYKFEDGLFGMRVLKNYSFELEQNKNY